jgi:hypothetical protein
MGRGQRAGPLSDLAPLLEAGEPEEPHQGLGVADLPRFGQGDGFPPREADQVEAFVLLGPPAAFGVGQAEIGGQKEVHPFGGKPGGRPEAGQGAPATGPIPGLLFQLPAGRRSRVLGLPVVVDVEGAGGNLQEGLSGRRAELPDEEDGSVGVEGDDGDGPRVPADVPLVAGSVGPFDGVNPEGQVAAAVEDAGLHHPFGEVPGHGVFRRH